MPPPTLDRPRLHVDFNEMIAEDLVLLSRDDSKQDSSGARVHFTEGMRVFLSMQDVDESGAPRHLLATGIVERNDAADWSSPVRWRCRIDRWNA